MFIKNGKGSSLGVVAPTQVQVSPPPAEIKSDIVPDPKTKEVK